MPHPKNCAAHRVFLPNRHGRVRVKSGGLYGDKVIQLSSTRDIGFFVVLPKRYLRLEARGNLKMPGHPRTPFVYDSVYKDYGRNVFASP